MKMRFIPFAELPYSDTCWSLIEGPDDRAYVAACCEHYSGGTVVVVRYDPRTEELEYLIDVADAVGQPSGNGLATQCKIHYSMIIADDGIMYAATHLSGPAVDQVSYNPWTSFNDPPRSFVGARLLAYDTRKEKTLFTDTLIPWEGCRCLALDQTRRRLYCVGYPRNHFYVYDLDERSRRDFGRIGSVNPQAIWLDARMRAYTTDDFGRLLVYDPEADELITTDLEAPHAPYQDGWHNMIYDVVQVPGTDDVVGVNWNVDPYLFRFSPGEEPGTGHFENLGPANPGIDGHEPRGVDADHTGGLMFSAAGELFLCVSRTDLEGDASDRRASLRVMNIETRETREVCLLGTDNGVQIPYVSRAVRIGPQHLILGVVGVVPMGIVHIVLDEELSQGPLQQTQRRYWG